jgi:hypothetical protein
MKRKCKIFIFIDDGVFSAVQGVTSSLLGIDLKASTLDKVETNSKKIEQDTSIEVNKSEKRPLERELEEDEPVAEKIDKRVRISGEDANGQSNLIRFQSTKTSNKIYNDWDDNETEDDDDKKTNRRSSAPSIKIVRRRHNKTNKISEQTRRISSKSSISSREPVVPMKKKIRIIRKRRTPVIRSKKQSTATWVHKYNIEECCIRLDLYNPIYETGMD